MILGHVATANEATFYPCPPRAMRSFPKYLSPLLKGKALNKFTRALVATVASGSLMFVGAGIAPIAAAQSDLSVRLVDANEEGSLTIHKFSNNTPGAAGDGSQITDTSDLGEPLGGATFRVTKVQDVDLTTNEGWEKAQQISDGTETPVLATNTVTQTTNDQGVTTFSGLELGLYYVQEIAAPAGHSISAAPFYVTVPMTDPGDRNAWMYDIHVYPKNQTVTDVVTKTVQDEDAITVGDNINFTVTGKLSEVEQLEIVEITDIYPSDRLSNPEVVSVTLGNDATIPASQYELDTTTPGLATVKFNADALATMDGLTGEERTVAVNFQFVVEDTTGTDAVSAIVNRAMVYDKGVGQDVTPPDPTDPNDPRVIPPVDPDNPDNPNVTRTYYGNVQVNKVGADGQGLAGVGFELYRCNDDKVISDANFVMDSLNTEADGTLRINGLHVNDFVNGSIGTTDPTGYCLVEVQAAAGHSLLAEPAYFQVLKGTDAAVALTSVDITNVEDNAGFELPFTGGEGVTLLLIVGGLIIAIGGGYAYVANRRQTQS